MGAARLVLASRSPQRSALLSQLGISFELAPSDVAERDTGDPHDVALSNALAKARATAAQARWAGMLVLGADTVVALDGEIYGKPPGRAVAERSLRALSGRWHEVFSAVVLLTAGSGAQPRTHVECTRVQMRVLSEELLAWYLASGEWHQRAGAYAIQGRGAALVRRIEGEWASVVGLPLAGLLEMAGELLVSGPD
jgi:septum formation protein